MEALSSFVGIGLDIIRPESGGVVRYVCALALWAGIGSLHAAPPPQTGASGERALLDQYCVTCHNQKLRTAGLSLDKIDVDHPASAAETWEKAIRKLRGGMMPPQGMPRPSEADKYAFIHYLETSLDQAAATHPNPGRAPLHRLNRTEYGNAVRDLIDLDIDVSALLPADDESNGFDNIADVLKVSPSLLEQYLAASSKIAALAVGDPNMTPVSQLYQVPPDLAQEEHIEGLPLGTRGGVLIHQNFPLDGDYDFSVALFQNIVGYVTGLEYPHQLEISIDGQRVFLAPVGGEEDNRMSDANLGVAKDTLDARLKCRVPVKAGPHAVAVAFLRRNASESDEPLQPFTRDLDLQNMNGIPRIDHVQITVAESIGIEGRGGYYDRAGALRDMVQNHMMQLLSLVAMEPPATFSADAVRDEKVKVLRSIHPIAPDEALEKTVRGQYGPGMTGEGPAPGYREEPDVAPSSLTETYVALRLEVENWR